MKKVFLIYMLFGFGIVMQAQTQPPRGVSQLELAGFKMPYPDKEVLANYLRTNPNMDIKQFNALSPEKKQEVIRVATTKDVLFSPPNDKVSMVVLPKYEAQFYKLTDADADKLYLKGIKMNYKERLKLIEYINAGHLTLRKFNSMELNQRAQVLDLLKIEHQLVTIN